MTLATLFRTILCPVDFSEHSRQALAYAAVLAAHRPSRLIVIFVEDPLLAAAAAVVFDQATLIEEGRAALRRFVEQTITPYGLSLKSVILEVAVGRPHRVIEWTAAAMKCDVIVMGSHGWTGPNEMMLGSTTHRLLRRSALPILATPPVEKRARRLSRKWPGRIVLAPIDLGTRKRSDARAASIVAKELGARLRLAHVVEPIPDIPWLELDEERRNRQRQRRALARLTALRDQLAGAIAEVHIETGRPADRIAALAMDRDVGLVILTRRRGQGLLGPRQGSISYRVLTRARVPVLALPSDTGWMRQLIRASRQYQHDVGFSGADVGAAIS